MDYSSRVAAECSQSSTQNSSILRLSTLSESSSTTPSSSMCQELRNQEWKVQNQFSTVLSSSSLMLSVSQTFYDVFPAPRTTWTREEEFCSEDTTKLVTILTPMWWVCWVGSWGTILKTEKVFIIWTWRSKLWCRLCSGQGQFLGHSTWDSASSSNFTTGPYLPCLWR